MQVIRDFILLSINILSVFLLANTDVPNIHPNRFRGNKTDYEALLAMKVEVSNGPQTILSSWNNSLPFCQWKGVICGKRHRRVVILELDASNLVGTLSPFVGNLSYLRGLSLYNNSFRGFIPIQITHLPRLRELDLRFNSFEGEIPTNVSRCFNLRGVFLSYNKLEGRIPPGFGTLPKLVEIHLATNNLTGDLQPIGFGNLSKSFKKLILDQNHLEGSIPYEIGKVEGLEGLSLGDNMLSGTIPSSLFNLSNLKDLYLSRIQIHGYLPNNIGLKLPQLLYLDISYNILVGHVPVSLNNLSRLRTLDISFNSFMGRFPFNGNNFPDLFLLDIESAFSLGGEARDLSFLDTLTNCTNLTYLLIGGNSFTGAFPPAVLNLSTSLQALGLNGNQITGHLPSGLGEVPSNGSFANTSIISVVGNKRLCGGIPELHLQRCPPPKEPRRRRLSLGLTIVIVSVACVLFLVLSIAFCLYVFSSSRNRNGSSSLQSTEPFLLVSYHMLSRATDGFSPSNVIGIGGFGTVYKGILQHDSIEMVVAVKVLNLQNQRASRSFIAECKALSNIRHRNLVKIITICSSTDPQRNEFKALVYEYMSQGSLETWLHSQSCSLTLLQRLNIAIDVASALEYLHTGCATPIIHCDLKPANILLDDELIARIGDFGLAKFILGASNETSSTQVRGTVGYVAPEYGLGSNVSPEGDIYSFGITVLEMMTSKKPTDPMFVEGLNLHDFVKSALMGRVMDILDQRMIDGVNALFARNDADIRKVECIKSLVMVGVHCSLVQPQERPSINNVLNELKSARQIILSGPRNQNTKQC